MYDYDLTGIIASTVNGEVTKYVKDPHGNVVVTSRNGSIAGEYDYSAFGEQLMATDTTNPFRYCGEYYDNENGLTYLRNRYYDSNTGRFLSEDPIKDGMNWYSYCGGDPVMLVDCEGLRRSGELIKIGTGRISDVKAIQNKLNNLGYKGANGKSLDVDGIFGSNTDYAVRQYQRDNGLSVDGIVGDATWEKMNLPNDAIYGIYYESSLVPSYKMKNKNYILLGYFTIGATTPEAAQELKQLEQQEIDYMTNVCIGSVNISGFTKHGLIQVLGRDGGKGVSEAALLDAVKNPNKVIQQVGGKIKYVGKNATVILNEARKVITAWATNSNGVR
ncbi:MAG: hypothetical protein HFE49_03020 [Clostridia bacterium]|nr:hypothetical protein [Clostridia bacterium]